MARNLPQLTLKATGKLNNHSLNHLKDTLELQRNLYNSSLGWLAHRPGSDFRVLRDSFRGDEPERNLASLSLMAQTPHGRGCSMQNHNF